jgi:hypothetical protein
VLALLLCATGCASDPYAGYAPVPAEDVVRMVSGGSLLIDATEDWPFQTLVYFAPGGHGWRDGKLVPGTEPRPGDMASLVTWRAADANGLCLVSAPLIGEIPSFVPPHKECMQVWQSTVAPALLLARAEDAQRSILAPASVTPGNGFAPARIAQYERQIRVLFGGQLPDWN